MEARHVVGLALTLALVAGGCAAVGSGSVPAASPTVGVQLVLPDPAQIFNAEPQGP